MLDDFLRAPGSFFSAKRARWVQLAGIAALAGEALAIALMEIFK